MPPPTPHLAQFSPLHNGRSFICYRDVNKAIEKHREIYGLRLVLKKAVKLENYSLTVEQMRDLNFRLKYGQLDYQCSVDNGRPGRPGNDERCPRLIRLRLSPDARTLVVYDTHVHDTPRFFSSSHQTLSPPCLVPEPMTVLSPNGVVSISQIKKTSPGSTNTTPTTTLATTPIYSSPHLSITPIESPTTPDSFHTPTSSLSSHEKITVKLKKSQFSPNEMVVVGSARDAQEQLELRNSPEKVPGNPSVMSPPDKLPKILPKQHFTAKFSEGSFTVSKVVRRPAIKPATGERVAGAPPERPPGRPLGRPPINRGEKVARAPIRPTTHNRAGDKVGARLGAGALSNGSSHTNGVRAVTTTGRKMTKRKKARHTEPSFDLSMLAPLDTELGVSEKQQLAHGVLLRLLRVTSQLPMIQFSHALDTLETLTDAYKLEQRVNLTISHDHEEESENLYHPDAYDVVDLESEEALDSTRATTDYQYDSSVSSTTPTVYDNHFAISQVDGAVDDLAACWGVRSTTTDTRKRGKDESRDRPWPPTDTTACLCHHQHHHHHHCIIPAP
ncbi:uncharacterized protein LOC123501985 isoform X2 [Portunus trituberculatus]|uniref:uncharacterized protein LOC123501985 isoform X2 n=1 Tax=Portunus trituberculatus TaxID=210409 RepID=UPI001E1CB575|nr:uncharacterized protein LOC123501985 isoform X2 [Portunus trituberculatus]